MLYKLGLYMDISAEVKTNADSLDVHAVLSTPLT